MNSKEPVEKSTEKKHFNGRNIGKVWKLHKKVGNKAEIYRILLLFAPKKGIISIMGQNGTFLFLTKSEKFTLSRKPVISFIPEDINGNKEF